MSPSASASAAPQGERRVLDRVVGVDVQVTLGAYGQVEPAVAGQLGEHVVEEADAGRDVAAARAVQVQLDPDLRLGRVPLDHRATAHPELLHRREERVLLRRCARRDPQPTGNPDVPHQHAAVEQRPPHALLVGELSEEDEVGVAVGHGEAQLAQPRHDPVPLGLDRST